MSSFQSRRRVIVAVYDLLANGNPLKSGAVAPLYAEYGRLMPLDLFREGGVGNFLRKISFREPEDVRANFKFDFSH